MELNTYLSKHHTELLRECWKYYRSKHDVWDLYQDSCVKMTQSFHTYNRNKVFMPWARRAVLTTFVDQARAKQRELAGHELCYVTDFDAYGEEQPMVEESVMELLGMLDEDDEALIRAVYVDGVSQSSVAKLLGVDKSTVNRRLGKAKIKIKELFDEHFEPGNRPYSDGSPGRDKGNEGNAAI